MPDSETLSHTKWDCKYHVVFIPKYRRKALYHESPAGARVFEGTVNVFLAPHAIDVPFLGRDVLDHFVYIFDRAKDEVLLLDVPDTYRVVSV